MVHHEFLFVASSTNYIQCEINEVEIATDAVQYEINEVNDEINEVKYEIEQLIRKQAFSSNIGEGTKTAIFEWRVRRLETSFSY